MEHSSPAQSTATPAMPGTSIRAALGSTRRFSFVCLCVGLGGLLLILSPTASAQTNQDNASLEELRRVVEQQQKVIETQQRRLDALENRLAVTDANQASPAAAASPTPPNETTPERTKPALSAQESVTTSPQASSPQAGGERTREGFGIKFYGFLRLDMAADTDRMSFDTQLPFFVLSPADPSQANVRTGDITMQYGKPLVRPV